jgi:hypothetical protein
MLKTFTWSITLLVLLASACRQDRFPPPLEFKGWEGNPVIVPGEPGSWDDLYVIMAFVLEYDDTIYLYYSAYNKTGSRALGLATSTDGYHFTKYPGNPILTGDGEGYDSFGVAQAQVLKADTGWVLYFNGREIAGFSSGRAFGRATALTLKGPWKKSEDPVMVTGKGGEWDADFIYLGPVIKQNDNSYLLFYSAGEHLFPEGDFFTGMATSKDGIHWNKYNDPATKDHPFADSDPVLMPDHPGEVTLICDIARSSEGLGMYYNGASRYAFSKDGIHWEKYHSKTVYTLADDPHYLRSGENADFGMQGNKLFFRDSHCLMYYDYAHCENSGISMAIAKLE